MIDLMKIPASDAERIAYAEGFTGTAELFGRIAALEHAASDLIDKLEKMAIHPSHYEYMREVLNETP